METSVPPRDPLEVTVTVPVPPERAFAAFTAEIGRWWPLRRHGVGGERSLGVEIEPREGGRIVETIDGDEPAVWGTVTRWSPPDGLSFTWHPGRPADATATDVTVTFAAAPGGGTTVVLCHEGWERLSAPEAARDAYAGGWPGVLADFAACAAGAA
jgi:uncharacterized protein YndB with AHSA1/START domain